MYSWNSALIAGTLLVAMVIALEAGHRFGRSRTVAPDAPAREHVSGVEGSLLGVLGLVLAFTFSIALHRFDDRSEDIVQEANAIGTTILRADLLPAPVRAEARSLLREYVDLRVHEGGASLVDSDDRAALLAETSRMHEALWRCARRAVDEDASPTRSGLFVQSLNESIDAFSTREAGLRRQVPEAILWLLFGTSVMIAGVVGFDSGVVGHRPASVTYVLVALVVVIVFMIIDLDRPRRGLILVDKTNLVELKSAFVADR